MKVTNLYNSNIQNSLRVDDAGSAAAELKSGDILEGLVTSSGKSTKVEFAQLNNKVISSKAVVILNRLHIFIFFPPIDLVLYNILQSLSLLDKNQM